MSDRLDALRAELDAAHARYAQDVTALACEQLATEFPDVDHALVVVELYPGSHGVKVLSLHRADGTRIADRDDWHFPHGEPAGVVAVTALGRAIFQAFEFDDWEAMFRLDVATASFAQIDAAPVTDR